MSYKEVNFDGLVGPTHNYAGLSFGNVASARFASQPSNPKSAALQGLAKMKMLSDLGLQQGVIAPHARPALHLLRNLGFSGTDSQVVEKAFAYNPVLVSSSFSSSAMWTANAATVCPSTDSNDGKVHFTAANLSNKLHRSIESTLTSKILKATFADEECFSHHNALPMHDYFADEGAANHTRLCSRHGDKGLHLFVYGREAFNLDAPAPSKYPARHTKEASEAVARLHQIDVQQSLFVQQNPDVIDQGVFHNDVIAVGNERMLFCHEQAFVNQSQTLSHIKEAFANVSQGEELIVTQVTNDQVSIDDAIGSYLFNSQLITLNSGGFALIAPGECQRIDKVNQYLQHLVAQNVLEKVHYVDLKQSMQNGGGPACLRLRAVLNQTELASVNPQCLLDEPLYLALTNWVEKHYRDRLTLDDLRDPQLICESYQALDELTQIMALGSIYDFQM
ncbi:N-succinylarginine dihydrolase [Pseudoalteromonas sp. GB56]